MGKVFDNPKEFFDSLSSEEFQALLDEFGFDYVNMRDLTDEEQKSYLEGLKKISTPTGVKLFND